MEHLLCIGVRNSLCSPRRQKKSESCWVVFYSTPPLTFLKSIFNMVHGPASQIALLLQLREQHGKTMALAAKEIC